MQRTAPHSASLPPVRLFLDDILDLRRKILQFGSGERLTVNGFQLDAADELVAFSGKRIDAFEIVVTKPFLISVEIRPFASRLYVSDPGSAGQAAFLILKEWLHGKIRPGARLLSKIWVFTGPFAGIFIVGIVVGFRINNVVAGGLSTVGLAGTLAIAYLGYQVDMRGHQLFAVDRASRPGFWRRNRDALTVAILATIVSALLGYFVGRLS